MITTYKKKQVWLKQIIGVLFATAIADHAVADNARGFYLGLGGASVENQLEATDSSRISTTELIGGYKYNGALGVEVRLGSAFKSGQIDSYVSADSPAIYSKAERDIASVKAIYYRPELVNDEARLYGLIGYASLSSTLKIKDTNGADLSKITRKFSGASYGIGIGFLLTDDFNLNFEYRTLCKEMNDKPDSFSINVDYRF